MDKYRPAGDIATVQFVSISDSVTDVKKIWDFNKLRCLEWGLYLFQVCQDLN
jgi:hypothetical protein